MRSCLCSFPPERGWCPQSEVQTPLVSHQPVSSKHSRFPPPELLTRPHTHQGAEPKIPAFATLLLFSGMFFLSLICQTARPPGQGSGATHHRLPFHASPGKSFTVSSVLPEIVPRPQLPCCWLFTQLSPSPEQELFRVRTVSHP